MYVAIFYIPLVHEHIGYPTLSWSIYIEHTICVFNCLLFYKFKIILTHKNGCAFYLRHFSKKKKIDQKNIIPPPAPSLTLSTPPSFTIVVLSTFTFILPEESFPNPPPDYSKFSALTFNFLVEPSICIVVLS